MPPKTKFEPEKIYVHLHQMLPLLYIEKKLEYFRKMKDFTRRDPKQPQKLTQGYSSLGSSKGLRPVSVMAHRLKTGSASNNQDEDETDVNNLAESIVNTMNLKTDSIRPRKIIGRESDQSFSNDSKSDDDDETEVTMIEVASVLSSNHEQAQGPIDNESHPSTSDHLEDQTQAPMESQSPFLTSFRSDDQNRNNNTVRLLSLPEIDGATESSKVNKPAEKPANPPKPSASMQIIDATDASRIHEEVAIASDSVTAPLNELLTNLVDTNTVMDEDDDWREIKLLVMKKMKKDHRLEQQLYHETLSATKTKMKKLEEKNKVLEKENEHWKLSLRAATAKAREDAADFKKQLDENDEAIKRLESEYAAKIEAMKLEMDEQWRNKKWCAICRKEIGAHFLNSEFCSFPCMRQSW